jgi:hypothetical protein
LDCEAFICQRSDRLDEAIGKFEEAVGAFAYSRAYLHLALALLERARKSTNGGEDLEAADRALKHAHSLRPTDLATDEVDEARQELAAAHSVSDARTSAAAGASRGARVSEVMTRLLGRSRHT